MPSAMRWSADLVTTMNKFKVGARAQSEFVSVLSPMGQDIIERR